MLASNWGYYLANMHVLAVFSTYHNNHIESNQTGFCCFFIHFAKLVKMISIPIYTFVKFLQSINKSKFQILNGNCKLQLYAFITNVLRKPSRAIDRDIGSRKSAGLPLSDGSFVKTNLVQKNSLCQVKSRSFLWKKFKKQRLPWKNSSLLKERRVCKALIFQL